MNIYGLVPIPDFCVCLKNLGFPQDKSALYWLDTGLRQPNNDPIFSLTESEKLEGVNGLRFAAPTAEEFQRIAPPYYFVLNSPNGFMLCDVRATTMREIEPGKMAVNFDFLKNSITESASECWAKSFIFLITKKMISFKKGVLQNGKQTAS